MDVWRRWAALGVATGVIGAVLPRLDEGSGPLGAEIAEPRAQVERTRSLRIVEPLGRLSDNRALAPVDPTPDLSALNLNELTLSSDGVESPLGDGQTAELTLDPDLQRTVQKVLGRHPTPEAGVVLLDVETGEVLVYASRVNGAPPFDVNARADAPAASIFKLVTAAALLEHSGIGAHTEQCYRGGQSRIQAEELLEDPARDRWCASLAMAMGRSINVVFARLARKLLSPGGLRETASAFGFGAPLPFDIETEISRADLPDDPLEFARAAAGFWHTTLSPIAAASLAQTVANAGVTLRPRIVRAVRAEEETVWRAPSEPVRLRRALPARAARELTRMMLQTVASGSAYKSFHTSKGAPYLPHIRVAGKTGTLTRHDRDRHYTWFVGFAPADKPEVAVAALAVNGPRWHIKGPQLGREALRAFFARRGYPGVSAP